ncbi:flagellar basal-body MS-ring/collar protein FliF [Parendozoicomonas sp. Alg238-R29]|uniref:flagellar basal-body MS-ring/collar protein FliF n=1 Tax=Parendozoicomonas sp. Alg238-R29 TaxID=2993446 RepID=UPI00248D63AE|nr:flagellar basal-body MS-ring/collar protein FliF [Parendozoicomonas sp. Alg238-R29]
MASAFSIGLGKLSELWQRVSAYGRGIFGSEGTATEAQRSTDNKEYSREQTTSKRAGYLWWSGGLLLFAIVFSSWLWLQDRDYRALYGRNESYDTAAVIECLERESISYRLHPDSGQVLVHANDISSARMALAQAGIVIPVRGQTSRSDKGSSLGVSHFTERARYIRGLEDELSRTIQGIDAVRLARVHLAVPEQSSFLRDTPSSRASVSLDIYQGEAISRAMVKGIIELVAGSVAGLDSSSVAVVDQSGKLLSAEVNDIDEGVSATSQQLAVRSQIEIHLENQVAKLVEAVSGPGRYRVDVSVDMDFSNQESAWEDFGPESGVLRSESISSVNKSATADITEATGSSVINGVNTPLVRNYEVNRQVNKVIRVPGRLLYLSVAVLLDYRAGENGSLEPWSEVELMSLQSLIEQAVGARDDRSDRVTVQSMPFFHPAKSSAALSGSLPKMPADTDRLYLIAGAAIALILLLSGLVVRMRSKRKMVRAKALAAAQAQIASHDESSFEMVGRAPASLSDEQLEARKRVLMAYASSEPDRVAMVLKNWMQSEDQ